MPSPRKSSEQLRREFDVLRRSYVMQGTVSTLSSSTPTSRVGSPARPRPLLPEALETPGIPPTPLSVEDLKQQFNSLRHALLDEATTTTSSSRSKYNTVSVSAASLLSQPWNNIIGCAPSGGNTKEGGVGCSGGGTEEVKKVDAATVAVEMVECCTQADPQDIKSATEKLQMESMNMNRVTSFLTSEQHSNNNVNTVTTIPPTAAQTLKSWDVFTKREVPPPTQQFDTANETSKDIKDGTISVNDPDDTSCSESSVQVTRKGSAVDRWLSVLQQDYQRDVSKMITGSERSTSLNESTNNIGQAGKSREKGLESSPPRNQPSPSTLPIANSTPVPILTSAASAPYTVPVASQPSEKKKKPSWWSCLCFRSSDVVEGEVLGTTPAAPVEPQSNADQQQATNSQSVSPVPPPQAVVIPPPDNNSDKQPSHWGSVKGVTHMGVMKSATTNTTTDASGATTTATTSTAPNSVAPTPIPPTPSQTPQPTIKPPPAPPQPEKKKKKKKSDDDSSSSSDSDDDTPKNNKSKPSTDDSKKSDDPSPEDGETKKSSKWGVFKAMKNMMSKGHSETAAAASVKKDPEHQAGKLISTQPVPLLTRNMQFLSNLIEKRTLKSLENGMDGWAYDFLGVNGEEPTMTDRVKFAQRVSCSGDPTVACREDDAAIEANESILGLALIDAVRYADNYNGCISLQYADKVIGKWNPKNTDASTIQRILQDPLLPAPQKEILNVVVKHLKNVFSIPAKRSKKKALLDAYVVALTPQWSDEDRRKRQTHLVTFLSVATQ